MVTKSIPEIIIHQPITGKKGLYRDSSDLISVLLYKNIWCDLSLEPSQRDGSNKRSYHMSARQF